MSTRLTHGARVAVALGSVFALAGCAASPVDVAVAPQPAPRSTPEVEIGAVEPRAPDDEAYWSAQRLAALEEAKSGFVRPPPPATTGGGATAGASSTAGEGDSAPAAATDEGSGENRTVSGTVFVTEALYAERPDYGLVGQSDERPESGSPCGSATYPELGAGVGLGVYDDEDTLVAQGALDDGRVTIVTDERYGEVAICEFGFLVEGVPPRDAYRLELADRWEWSFDRDELEATGWAAVLLLET